MKRPPPSRRGIAQAELNRALADDIAANAAHRNPGREGLAARVDLSAVANAVLTEGREVMTSAGRGYWRDMYRRYPHLRVMDGRPRGDDRSLNQRRGPHGVASIRRRQDGSWERWIPASGWTPCPAPLGRYRNLVRPAGRQPLARAG